MDKFVAIFWSLAKFVFEFGENIGEKVGYWPKKVGNWPKILEKVASKFCEKSAKNAEKRSKNGYFGLKMELFE